MAREVATKWLAQDTINSCRDCATLIDQDKSIFAERLTDEERAITVTGADVLRDKIAGQKTSVTTMKEKTGAQDKTMLKVHASCVDIRRAVRKATRDSEIRSAFGLGKKLSKTVQGIFNAGSIIVKALQEHGDWAKANIGLLPEEIAELQRNVADLASKDNIQESSKLTKKMETLSRDKLQRTLEDLVTKVSDIGVRYFRSRDAQRMQLYRDLIPSSRGGSGGGSSTGPAAPPAS
jgi:hypothetical protein